MRETIVKLDKISKYYGSFAAVDELDLEINRGEIVGIIGHNGAGKTTTLKMMVGLIAPTGGSMTHHGTGHSEKRAEGQKVAGLSARRKPAL